MSLSIRNLSGEVVIEMSIIATDFLMQSPVSPSVNRPKYLITPNTNNKRDKQIDCSPKLWNRIGNASPNQR
jgi:hypothetical protein